MKPEELLSVLHTANRLKDTTRHCWTPGNRHESGAAPAGGLALAAFFLRDEFPETDMDKVIKMCLIHDLGECFTGDIPSFLKTDADTAKEDALLIQWVGTLPQPYRTEMAALYAEMDALETPEARLYKALDKLDAVLLEVPKVRKDLGYPPLVTPMSQMVGVQATVNVLTGGRYKNVSKEIKAYVKGEYGRAPGKIDPEVQKLVLGDEKPITQRYADLLEPGFEKAKRELGERAHSDEDVLSYIAFPAQAEAYFEKRDRKEDDNEIHFSIREVK